MHHAGMLSSLPVPHISPSVPTLHDRMRLAVESLCDLRTIAKAYSGRYVLPASYIRIQHAALALGLPPPPTPALRPARTAGGVAK